MELKNSSKANPENKRNLFLQIGIVLALAVVLLSFQYISPAEDITEVKNVDESVVIAPVVEPDNDNAPYSLVEEMPEFPGGPAAMMAFLAENVKYPKDAVEREVSGIVKVNFVVNVDGSIADVKVLHGVDPSLDKAAVAVVESMPKWSPGKQDGKVVRVLYNVPISFQL